MPTPPIRQPPAALPLSEAFAYTDLKAISRSRAAPFSPEEWQALQQALAGQPLDKPLPGDHPILWAIYHHQEGHLVYADQHLGRALEGETVPLNAAMALNFGVHLKLARNLFPQAQQVLNKLQHRWPDDDLLPRAVTINEALTEMLQGDEASTQLHLTLCRQLIEDGLVGLALLHLPVAMLTLALAGNAAGLSQLAQAQPGFSGRTPAALEYAIGLSILGDHQAALTIFQDQPLERAQTPIAIRARLHRAAILGERGAMRSEVLALTELGINPFHQRELRFLSNSLKHADTLQVFSATLRNHLGTENGTQIYIELLGEHEQLRHAQRRVHLGRHSSASIRLLALLAYRARQDEPVVSTEDCIQELLTGPEYTGRNPRQLQVQIATLVRNLRREIGEQVILTHTGPGGYALNPKYQVTFDLDLIDRLLEARQLREASSLLAQGVLQGEQPGQTLGQVRSDLYAALFHAIRDRALDEDAPKNELQDAVAAFMPWQWPDEKVESEASRIYHMLLTT